MRGIRFGCVLSSGLFFLYSEMIMRTIIKERKSLSIGGQNLNNRRLADDIVLIAGTQDELQNMLPILKEASKEKGLTMNIHKSKMKMISKKGQVYRCQVKISNHMIKQVRGFCYLRNHITKDGRSNIEMKRQIAT